VRQEIVLEPIEMAVIFATANAVAIGGPMGGLRMDGQATLLLPAVPAARLRYEVDSVPPRLHAADEQVTLADYPKIPAAYLQLPAGSERLVGLARQVVGPVDRPDELPVLAQARRLERHLQENYRYTLEVKPPRQLSAIDDFLFEQKAGYCEYYATAMVLMLRGLGIPARMTSGFLQGEWNSFGNYFTVRQQDAHTWVEVYFPRTGWFPFDPTPSTGEAPAAVLSRLRQLADTLWVSWDRYIVRYSVRDQWAALQEMRAQGAAWQARSGQWIESAKEAAAHVAGWVMRRRELFLLAVAVGCFGFLVMRWWVQRHGGWPVWRTRTLRAAQRRGRTFYARLLWLLAARGIERPPAMTAREFLRHAGPQLGAAAGATAALTDYYYRLRFGAQVLTVQEEAEVRRLLRQVAQSLSALRPNGAPSPDRPSAAPTATRRPPSPE
jgi:transglutaminase-like putative cysteine protease